MPRAYNSKSDEDLKPWTCGSDRRFPLDSDENVFSSSNKTAGNPWRFVVEHLSTIESVRCDAWKDEVQNLLIFSGLFSAVVTAFIIESYKSLRVDSTDIAVVLLSHIAATLPNTTNTEPLLSSSSFSSSPSPSNLRVNAFWFLSLNFSLATAVTGIVSLQWLREHRRPMPGISPRIQSAMLHMHAESIDRYLVSRVFAGLPLLLLIGLVLFLIGLVDFLWDLNHVVAAPILAATALTLLFLLYTTVAPGLQAFPFHHSRREKYSQPLVPCPYRSPQSWTFLRLVAYIKFKTLSEQSPWSFDDGWLGYLLGDDWTTHGLSWLRQRDIECSGGSNPDHPERSFCDPAGDFSPLYDGLHSLLTVKANLSGRRDKVDELTALYKCMDNLSTLSYGKESRIRTFLAEYLEGIFPPNPKSQFQHAIPRNAIKRWNPSADVLVDNVHLLFCAYSTERMHFERFWRKQPYYDHLPIPR